MADQVDDGVPARASDLKGDGYEIFMAALSVLSIINVLLAYAIQDVALDTVIILVNILLTLFFLGDFLYRLLTAQSKSQYFLHGYGWADLLASLPFAQAKLLRFFRLIKVVRLLRERGGRRVARTLIRDRAGSALLTLLLLAILMLEFGSLEMLRLEKGMPGANISTAVDAMWYVLVTMATVGYGDQFPVTNAGRLMGSVIIIIGVGIFGTLTGYLANAFLSPRPPEAADATQPVDIELRLEQLKALAIQQQAVIDELETMIAEQRG